MSDNDMWNPDDFMDLLPDIYRLDKESIFTWTKTRLTTRRDTIQFIYSLAHSCAGIMQEIATREGGELSRFGVLQTGSGASRSELMTARFLTATLNDDRDMQRALMGTLIEHTESTEDAEDIAQVQVQLIAILSGMLHDMADVQVVPHD